MSESARERIATLEAEIDRLEGMIESCRKTILVGRALLLAGAALLLAAVWRGGGILLVTSVASGLGGVVLAGSTDATRRELLGRMTALKGERAALIEALPMSLVR